MSMVFCAECGNKMSSKAKACPSCGRPNAALVKADEKKYKGNKSVPVYLVLCWFLGCFGAHRYYSGKIGSAVAMTILGITIIGLFVTGIWALVDFIIGLCNLHAPEKLFRN